jgi:hypothetical protein
MEVRQVDALSASLFNVALNMVLEGIVEKGNIVYKSKQICAYADDIVLSQETLQHQNNYYLHWKLRAKKKWE